VTAGRPKGDRAAGEEVGVVGRHAARLAALFVLAGPSACRGTAVASSTHGASF